MTAGSSTGQCSSSWVDSIIHKNRRTLLKARELFPEHAKCICVVTRRFDLVGNNCRGHNAFSFDSSNNYLFNSYHKSGTILGFGGGNEWNRHCPYLQEGYLQVWKCNNIYINNIPTYTHIHTYINYTARKWPLLRRNLRECEETKWWGGRPYFK